MNILGVHIGHDSSAALISAGHLVADVAEERFARVKHFTGLPTESVDYCLSAGGIRSEDLDVIATTSCDGVVGLNHMFALDGQRRERASPSKEALRSLKIALGRKTEEIPPLYFKQFPLAPRCRVAHVEHHLAHAASAYYSSQYRQKTLIVTCDGVGDGVSLCLWRGENGKITPLEKFSSSGSLGWFYSNVTEALGLIHGDGEGTTMGLAPYGDYERCRGVLSAFHPHYENGKLVRAHDFGTSYCWNEKGSYEFHFEEARQIKALVDRYGAEHIAAEAQRVLEEQLAQVIFPWLEKEGTRSLCCAGGVFLNVKLNQRVWCSGKVDDQFVYPNAGDSGLAHGAALWVAHNQVDVAPVAEPLHLYYGPQFGDDEIQTLLKSRGIRFHVSDRVEEYVADALAADRIVAWFQGRMESGPRSLGNRSILMSPAKSVNKDIINGRVKFRQAFRPFCPSMLAEVAPDYLENYRSEPFMITSFDVKLDKAARIPAVVHKDQTLRPQTVEKEINPRYWKLLAEFGKRTGDPVLLNTSFNIKGEPMICSPREAIRGFFDSGIDLMAMGNVIIEKGKA
jgi:carbamoyltransferase